MIKEGKSEEEALHICETKVYKNGVMATKIASITGRSLAAAGSTGSMAVAGGAMASPVAWAFAGLLFAA